MIEDTFSSKCNFLWYSFLYICSNIFYDSQLQCIEVDKVNVEKCASKMCFVVVVVSRFGNEEGSAGVLGTYLTLLPSAEHHE